MSSPTPAPGHPDRTDRPATPSRAESAGWGNPMEAGLKRHGSHGQTPRGRSPGQVAVLVIGLISFLLGVAGFLPAVTVNDDILWFSDLHYAIHTLLGAVGLALILLSILRGPHKRRPVSPDHDPATTDDKESRTGPRIA